MKWKERLLFFVGGFILLGIFMSLISTILLPFVVAVITAYFLDPVADKLEKWGLSRTMATLTIVVSFFLLLIIAGLLLVPVLYQQSVALIHEIPNYTRAIQNEVLPSISRYMNRISPESVDKAKEAISNTSGSVIEFVTTLAKNILSSGLAVVNLLSLLFVTPIVTFYVLRDWDAIVAKINGFIPPLYAPVIREQCREIDRTLSGYIRGQTNVCLILGVFYAIGLSLAGLNFGLFIGLGTGLLSFIPYVGVLFGLVIGLTVAFFQFGDWVHVGIVASVFLIGQFLEGNFVTPKLVGGRVNLHPVWVIFALLAGGALFGFTGLLLAVPVAAILGVLIRFALRKYLLSPIYSDGIVLPPENVIQS